jgi:phosphatidylglycerol---prolipoprotein diacylglyceryl transferase
MYQIVFRIPFLNLPIYGYGLMLVVAFLVGIQLSKYMALKAGLDGEAFMNAALIALAAGVLGARLSSVFENWHTYMNPERSMFDNFIDAINIRNGGLTFYGGFLLATPCCIAYALYKKLNLLVYMDVVAPVLMLGLGFGRIGCYLNGCCYGELARPTWGASAMEFPYDSYSYQDQFFRGLVHPPQELLNELPDGTVGLKNWDQVKAEGLTDLANQQHALPVQPTQLYSSLTGFLLAGLLWAYWTMDHQNGRVFALMLMLEGPARFVLELIRVEPPVLTGRFAGIPLNMSFSMVIGILVGIAGVVMWLALVWKKSLENRRIFATAH